MYLSAPFNRVIALDPETGQEKWSFDPKIDLNAPYSEGLINRGVALWSDSSGPARDKASIDRQFRKPHWWNKLDVRWQILGVCKVLFAQA
jgi:glucose dehydrogenase